MWPLARGGEIRQWQTLQAMKECGDVDVLVFQPKNVVPPPEAYDGCRRLMTLDSAILQLSDKRREQYKSTIGRMLLTFANIKPLEYQTQSTSSHVQWFKQLVESENYDAIWFSKAITAMSLQWSDPIRTVVDGDDFDSVREYHLLRNSPWYGAKVANYFNVLKLAAWEAVLPSRFAYVARCSEADRRRLPRKNVAVVPNGTVIPEPPIQKIDAVADRLFFVGTLSYAPNINGLEWFFEKVWPKIREQLPNLGLDVVGGGAPESILSHHQRDGVLIHGKVRDLTPFWRSSALSIAPLLAGGGTRLKILESLAHSTPVVATPIGAYGLELTPDQGVVCASTPEHFADSCVSLLKDPARRKCLAVNGLAAVRKHYDWLIVRRKMQGLIESVAKRAR